ncbi:MAG TPA: Ig-like domain-containing protein [Mycobacteriales bacterium]|nr:Ig-like domain-containing protein [Mycobacteriales bacterium]
MSPPAYARPALWAAGAVLSPVFVALFAGAAQAKAPAKAPAPAETAGAADAAAPVDRAAVRRFGGQLPTPADDTAATPEDTPVRIAVLANDTDPEGDRLTAVAVSTPSLGSATIGSDGVITFTPDFNAFGTDTFTYSVSDGTSTASAAVTVTITAVNDPPVYSAVATNTRQDVRVGEGLTGLVATDADGTALQYRLVEGALPGGILLNADGTFSGQTTLEIETTAVIEVTDGTATALTRLVVAVTAAPTTFNTNPVAGDDIARTAEDTAVTFSVTANDSDPDGDRLAVTAFGDAVGGRVACGAQDCTFTPDPDFTGTATFSYTVTDGFGGSDVGAVRVTVTPVNDPPEALADTAATQAGTAVRIDVLANDTDVDGDRLSVTVTSSPANGAVSCTAGVCTYTPVGGFTGSDRFTYTASDGKGGSSVASVTIRVTAAPPPPNSPPVARDDVASVAEDSVADITVTANDSDSDPDQALAVIGATRPLHGSVECAGTTCRYVPDPDFSGTDSFRYTVSDGAGGSATATVRITVTPVEDPPLAAADEAITAANSPITINVLANDRDPDGQPLRVVGATDGGQGTVVCTATTCTYSPAADITGSDTFSYRVSDPTGRTASATVRVTILAVANAAPVFTTAPTNTSQTVALGRPLRALLATDADGDAITFSVTSGTLPAGLALNPDGTFAGVPSVEGTFSIVVMVADAFGGSSTGRLDLTVRDRLDLSPTALDDRARVTSGAPVVIPVLGNDSDPDGDPLTIVSVTQPRFGQVICGATTCTYRSTAGFAGADAFVYTVSDGFGGVDTAVVRLTVLARSAPTVPGGPGPVAPGGGVGSPPTVPDPPIFSRPDVGPVLVTTGGPTASLTRVALLLLVAGTALSVIGRRRTRRPRPA